MLYRMVNWEEFHEDVIELGKRIAADATQFDVIIGIARGGLLISHILSDILDVPVTSLTITSYAHFEQIQEPVVTYAPHADLSGKRILLTDDISDTGKTFEVAIAYLKERGAAAITTAAPFVKPHTHYTPHYYTEQTEAWIIFPWDIKETINTLTRIWRKDESRTDIKHDLEKVGFKKQHIDAFFDETDI